MKILENILDGKEGSANSLLWQIAGPLFVLCTFALSPDHLSIFLIGVLGLFLCCRWQMTGFFSSLILLLLASLGEHYYFQKGHLWLLGIQGSYAIAFFITALNAEGHTHFVKNLFSQMEMRDASILNLEEEFSKSRETMSEALMRSQEKAESLQKLVEETSQEHSSLLVLNDVLRKTTARKLEENDLLHTEFAALQNLLVSLQNEKDALQKELLFFKNSEKLVLENQKLIDEINCARLEKEQTHGINETLAKLHAKENAKALEANAIAASLEEKVRSLEEELSVKAKAAFAYEASLNEQKALWESTLSSLKTQIEEKEQNFLAKQEDWQKERESFAQEAKAPIVDLTQYVAKAEAAILEERIKNLSKVEPLYRQLKAQFAEKNDLLHQTRSELFLADTERQVLKMELERLELSKNLIAPEIISEFSEMEEKIEALVQENEELQSLVTCLSASPSLEKPKRKKKASMTPEQSVLF